MEDCYEGSVAGKRLASFSGRDAWAFLFDLDGTLAENHHPTTNEITARKLLLALAESKGTPVFSTARTPELLMSEAVYAGSRDAGFTRPLPKWGVREDGSRYFVPLSTLSFFEGLLDPPVMNCFGTGIFVLRGDAFHEDREYQNMLGGPGWRTDALNFIRMMNDGAEEYLAPIEAEGAYLRSLADVAPLPFRLELRFCGEGAERACTGMSERVGRMRSALLDGIIDAREYGISPSFAKDLSIVDESHPALMRYQRYFVPAAGRKEAGVARITSMLARQSGVRKLRRFVAGDTMTDLPSMLEAVNAGGVAVLAGGSRLSPRIAEGVFYGEQIAKVIEAMSAMEPAYTGRTRASLSSRTRHSPDLRAPNRFMPRLPGISTATTSNRGRRIAAPFLLAACLFIVRPWSGKSARFPQEASCSATPTW